ncbi:hypothetical protein ACFQ08_38545, partial [Streptosporangium algeriense]
MHVTRKTWISAGVVGLVLAGGVSVTAAASADRVEKIWGVGDSTPEHAVPPATQRTEQPQVTDVAPPSGRTPAPEDGSGVSRDVNPDPGAVGT